MGEVIPHLHLMEQVSSSEHIGTMAENLLRVLSENETVNAKVNSVLIVLIQLLPYSVHRLHHDMYPKCLASCSSSF